MKALLTRKIGMTSTIEADGSVVGVTLLSVDPNVVTQIKSTESDGYNAVQVGSFAKKKTNKPMTGHTKKVNKVFARLKEIRIRDNEELQEDLVIGKELTSEVFSVGDIVDVTSDSKGKGFAGTIKRHNFHRGRKTHGGRSYRRPGSIGSMYPQKIFKGKKMSGQMGDEQVTIKKLTVVLVDPENSVIGVKGSVPGPKKSVVLLKEFKK